jgi:hypothetical protein
MMKLRLNILAQIAGAVLNNRSSSAMLSTIISFFFAEKIGILCYTPIFKVIVISAEYNIGTFYGDLVVKSLQCIGRVTVIVVHEH